MEHTIPIRRSLRKNPYDMFPPNGPAGGRYPTFFIYYTLPYRHCAKERTVDVDFGDYAEHVTFIPHPSYGLPYGTVPRLLLLFLANYVKKHDTALISLPDTIQGLGHLLGYNHASGGDEGQAAIITSQLRRLLELTIRRELIESGKRETVLHYTFARTHQVYWDNPIAGECSFFLDDLVYHDLKKHAMPVDMYVVQELKRSPFTLDLYLWLSYKLNAVRSTKVIPVSTLMKQFGNYGNSAGSKRQFLHKTKRSLLRVKEYYPGANIFIRDTSLVLEPSEQLVAPASKNPSP
jgi:hypothetical protein